MGVSDALTAFAEQISIMMAERTTLTAKFGIPQRLLGILDFQSESVVNQGNTRFEDTIGDGQPDNE